MAKRLLRFNEVRVLLALKGRGQPLTIDEIVAATADDTPNKKGISKIMVTRALNGMDKSEKSHEYTGYLGLLEREFVTRVGGDRFQISLPDSQPNSSSEETDEDQE